VVKMKHNVEYTMANNNKDEQQYLVKNDNVTLTVPRSIGRLIMS